MYQHVCERLSTNSGVVHQGIFSFFEMGFLTSLQPVNWLNWLFTSARTLGISSSRIISLCQQTIFHFLYGFRRSSSGPCTGKASTLPSEPYLLPYFITCLIY